MDKLIPLFVFFSFLSDGEKNVTFRAASNDMAEIILSLNKSHQMALTCKPLAENSSYHYRGNWELRNGFYELTFAKEPKGGPDVQTIFEDSKERVQILSTNKVRIPETESRIKIWGIICVRE